MNKYTRFATNGRNKIIIFSIIALLIIAGVGGYLLLGTPSKSKKSSLDNYDDGRVPWTFTYKDLSNKYSKKEKAQIKKECLATITDYNKILFTFNQNTTEFKDSLKQYYVPYDTDGTDAYGNDATYSNFKKLGVESSFIKYKPYTIFINDSPDIPSLTINGLMTIDYKDKNLPKGKYDVALRVTLSKMNGKWVIYQTKYSTIFNHGSVKAFIEDECNLVYVGKRVGNFH